LAHISVGNERLQEMLRFVPSIVAIIAQAGKVFPVQNVLGKCPCGRTLRQRAMVPNMYYN